MWVAAREGARVWWLYAVVEAALVIAVPLVRALVARAAPNLVPVGPAPFVSPTFTFFCLVGLPLAGATLGALEATALAALRGPGVAARAWRAGALVTLCLAFALNALLEGEVAASVAASVPLALSLVALLRGGAEHEPKGLSRLAASMPVVLLLVGLPIVAQPRRYLAVGAVLAFGAGVLLAVWFLAALAARFGPRRVPRGRAVEFAFVALAAAGLVLAARWVDPAKIRTRRDSPSVRGTERRPNVVLVTLDTVRADHLSLCGYGRDTSPFLKEWAARDATVYTQAYSTSNWTVPTHASLFTGQSPRVHGARMRRDSETPMPIRTRSTTLAEMLAGSGYETFGVIANSVSLVPALGFDRGFSEYDVLTVSGLLAPGGRPYLLRDAVRRSLLSFAEPSRRWAAFAHAGEVVAAALARLDARAGRDRPFFLFLNFMDAHVPYVPPELFANRFPGRVTGFSWSRFPGDDFSRGRNEGAFPGELVSHLVSQYDGAIAYLDDQLRSFVESLRDRGLYEDTLIVVTADHGEAFGEHGFLGHRKTLYQEMLHVPLIVKYPYARTGAVVDDVVSQIDVLPTVADVIGREAPAGTEGLSLRAARAPDRCIIAEGNYADGAAGPRADEPSEVALIRGSLKTITQADGTMLSFDLAQDPGERCDRERDLRLAETWGDLRRSYIRSGRGRGHEAPVSDPEVLGRLRSLGYLR